MRIRKLDKGMSNVVATILLVALVIALVALLTFIFFNIGGEKSYKSATGSVELSATNSGIEATVLESGNAEKYIIDGPNAELPMGAETGDTIQANDGTGEYAVIAVMPDGTSQVVQTTQIEEIDSEGYFVVTQYTDDKEAYAEIINTYESIDEYEIIVNAEEDDTSTVSTTVNNESNTGLLSYFSDSKQPKPDLLKFDVAPGQKLNVGGKNPIFSVAEIAKRPNKSQFSPEQEVAVHKMTNLCKGDEIHLVNSESNTDEKEVVATGEEIKFDSEGCDEIRKVAEYEGGKIVGVKLINLWHRSVDYSVFAWNGDVPPPTQPVKKGTVTAKVKVVDTSDNPIENADVQLANRSGSTDSSGEAFFNDLPKEDVTMFATAEKSGFYSNSTPVEITDDITTASPDVEETVTLKPRDEQTPTQEKSGTVPSEGSTSIDFSSPKSSATVTGGSGGGSGGGGGGSGGSWGGGGSYTSSGGGIYDGSSTESTQTLSSATPTEEEEVYVDIEQPDRQFNTIPIDDRIIPTGSEGKFEVRTSVLATESPDSGSTIEDEVIVTAVSESGTNISLSGDNQRKTVELEPNKVSTVSQEFYFPSGKGLADKNYTIFVSLDSSSNIKTAGTLEVFDGSKLSTTINGAKVSPQNPTLDSDTDSVDVDITVDSSNITWNGASEVTLDIFENGQLINRKTIQQSSFSGYTYTRTHESTGYYDYHVGIMESQDVSLADSVLVQGSNPSNIDFDVNLTTTSDNCGSETPVGDQFDCEILVGESIDLKGEVNVSGMGADELENAEIVWTWGEVPDNQERVYADNTSSNPIDWNSDLSSYSVSNYDDSITGFTTNGLSLDKKNLQYDTSEAYILELRISGEDASTGKEIGLQDDITLNVAKDPSETTTEIIDSSVVSGFTNRGTIELESGRESYEETVDLGFYKEKSDGSKTLIRSENDISVVRSGDTENVTTSFTLSDYQQSDEKDTATVYIGLFKDGATKDYSNSIDTTKLDFVDVKKDTKLVKNDVFIKRVNDQVLFGAKIDKMKKDSAFQVYTDTDGGSSGISKNNVDATGNYEKYFEGLGNIVADNNLGFIKDEYGNLESSWNYDFDPPSFWDKSNGSSMDIYNDNIRIIRIDESKHGYEYKARFSYISNNYSTSPYPTESEFSWAPSDRTKSAQIDSNTDCWSNCKLIKPTDESVIESSSTKSDSKGEIVLDTKDYWDKIDLTFFKEKENGDKTRIRNVTDITVYNDSGKTVTEPFVPTDYRTSEGDTTATVYIGLSKNDTNLKNINNAMDTSSITFTGVNPISYDTSGGYKEVSDLQELQGMKYDLDADYKLVNDIDASATSSWNNGKGFEPIGSYSNPFIGKFNGQGHTINNLHIDRPNQRYVGLFSGLAFSSSLINNTGLKNVDIIGKGHVAGIAGYSSGEINKTYTTGVIESKGSKGSGGLIGKNSGEINNSYSQADVYGSDSGGLVSYAQSRSKTLNSYVAGYAKSDPIDGQNIYGPSIITVDSVYWDKNAGGDVDSVWSPDATGLTTSEMQGDSAKNNMNLDFDNTWDTVSGDYPELSWQE